MTNAVLLVSLLMSEFSCENGELKIQLRVTTFYICESLKSTIRLICFETRKVQPLLWRERFSEIGVFLHSCSSDRRKSKRCIHEHQRRHSSEA